MYMRNMNIALYFQKNEIRKANQTVLDEYVHQLW
jgi:hypothetical protein